MRHLVLAVSLSLAGLACEAETSPIGDASDPSEDAGHDVDAESTDRSDRCPIPDGWSWDCSLYDGPCYKPGESCLLKRQPIREFVPGCGHACTCPSLGYVPGWEEACLGLEYGACRDTASETRCDPPLLCGSPDFPFCGRECTESVSLRCRQTDTEGCCLAETANPLCWDVGGPVVRCPYGSKPETECSSGC